MPRSSCADGSAMFTIDASRMIISWAAARTTSAHHRPGSGSALSDGLSAAGTGSLIVTPRVAVGLPEIARTANHAAPTELPTRQRQYRRACGRKAHEDEKLPRIA